MSDANDLVNINFNDKSKCSDKSNKNNKSNRSNKNNNKNVKKNPNIIDFKKSINRYKNNYDINCVIGNKKAFKDIKSENTDNLNIINKEPKEESKDKKRNNNIIPNHYTNFSFGGNNLNSNNTNTNTNANNYNDHIINDDYVSPTFNIKVNFNSPENSNSKKNNNKNSNSKNESRNKNINKNINKNSSNNTNNKTKKESKTTHSSNNTSHLINSKFKKIELNVKNKNKINIRKKKLSSNNIFIREKSKSQSSLDKMYQNKEHKYKPHKHSYLDSNKTFNKNLLSRLYSHNQSLNNSNNNSNKVISNNSKSKSNLISSSSPKNKLISIKSTNSNSNSSRRNLINTSKILLKKNKSSLNIKYKENKMSNKTSSNKIKLLFKDKDNNKNNQRKSPMHHINKFSLLKKIKTNKKSPEKIFDKSAQNAKEKTAKIQERIAKTSLSSYRNSSHEDKNSIKTKSKVNMIYTRKRNINEKYNKIFNNLSNNSSKDSSKIYYSVSNKSFQSIDKNKSLNKTNVFANNDVTKQKINQNKKNLIYNKCNKNFVAIQNFSRYKKKSVLFYKNKSNETNVNSNYYLNC